MTIICVVRACVCYVSISARNRVDLALVSLSYKHFHFHVAFPAMRRLWSFRVQKKHGQTQSRWACLS